MTRSADVRILLVGKKYIGASIEALRVPLQTSRTLGQPCEVGIVGHDDEYVDVLGSALAVVIEPRRAIRRTPAICRADATNRRRPSSNPSR
jgi:hypothetical protein